MLGVAALGAEFWYKTSHDSSIGMIPVMVVYGRDPPALIHYQVTTTDPPNLQEMLQLWVTVLVQLKANLNRTQ